MTDPASKPRVGLFVTCLVDIFRPSVGFAAVKLLEDSGCVVEVPAAQTCCGQPAYNSGDRADTKALAKRTIAAFEPFDYVVVPSGSCGGMIKEHYPELLADEPDWAHRALNYAPVAALKPKGYGRVRCGSIIRVAPLDKLQKEK